MHRSTAQLGFALPLILAIDQGTTGTTCLVFDREGRIAGRAYSEFEQHFPAARLGRARRDRDLGGDAAGRAAGDRRRRDPGRRPGRDRDHQPARDRRRLGPRDGRARPPRARLAGPPHRGALRRAREAGHEALVRERTGLVIDPYFSGTKIEWLLRERRGGARRRLRDDRLLARLQAHRAPRHRLLERLADDAVRHPRAALGRRALRPARGRSSAACPSRFPRPQIYGRTDDLRRRRPGGRDRRRPAGGAVRPGLPAAGHGQEHLRDRQLRPPQHRLATRRSPARACSRRSPGAWAPRPTTRSRRRCSSPAPPSSGFATGSGSSASAAESEGLAASLDSNDGVYFVPALTGLGSPHWDPYARGHDRRPDARLGPGPAGARRAGGDRLPDRGRGAGAGGGRRARRSRC